MYSANNNRIDPVIHTHLVAEGLQERTRICRKRRLLLLDWDWLLLLLLWLLVAFRP